MEQKYYKKRVCRLCAEKKHAVSYKEVYFLKGFLTERGKIIPSRISGNCAPHQRKLTAAVKRSRSIALLAFSEER
ncbi:MAG: 30S ribosomal protein S18 [Nitrospiria bacterium]